MAETRITQLGEMNTVTSDDYVVVVDGATAATKKVQAGNMLVDGGVTTAKIAATAVTFAKLLPTIFGGQVQSYTNTGTGGGTGYYLNLGGLKLCWGVSGSLTSATNQTITTSLPSGFFSSVTGIVYNLYSPSATNLQANWAPNNFSVSQLQAFLGGVNGSTTGVSWLVIGT